MPEDSYEGLPLSQLQIDDVYWSEDASDHIRHRSQRKGRPKEFDVDPTWATEAALEVNRVVALNGKSIQVVGRSQAHHPSNLMRQVGY